MERFLGESLLRGCMTGAGGPSTLAGSIYMSGSKNQPYPTFRLTRNGTQIFAFFGGVALLEDGENSARSSGGGGWWATGVFANNYGNMGRYEMRRNATCLRLNAVCRPSQ